MYTSQQEKTHRDYRGENFTEYHIASINFSVWSYGVDLIVHYAIY